MIRGDNPPTKQFTRSSRSQHLIRHSAWPILFLSLILLPCFQGLATAETPSPPTKTEMKPSANFIPTSAYRIGAGDILDISVWKDDALTKLMPVLPDGTISFPLVGKITAAGRTLEDFKLELERRIARYVPEPVLSVSVHQVDSMIIYVIGRVRAPGRIILNTNVTALQALAMAGGPDPFASRNKIKIFREEPNRTLIFDFPYEDISQGKHLNYNIPMKRGDVMVVP